MQDLWATVADMLVFLKDAKLVIDMILAPIVSDIMKQIYHCAIFIREYGGKGFFSQSTYQIHLPVESLMCRDIAQNAPHKKC